MKTCQVNCMSDNQSKIVIYYFFFFFQDLFKPLCHEPVCHEGRKVINTDKSTPLQNVDFLTS